MKDKVIMVLMVVCVFVSIAIIFIPHQKRTYVSLIAHTDGSTMLVRAKSTVVRNGYIEITASGGDIIRVPLANVIRQVDMIDTTSTLVTPQVMPPPSEKPKQRL